MNLSERTPDISSKIWASRSEPRVQVPIDCVSPRVNKAEPWTRGRIPVAMVIGRIIRKVRPSIRFSPAKILSRTMFLSSSKKILAISLSFSAQASLDAFNSSVTSFWIWANLSWRSSLSTIRKASPTASWALVFTASIKAVSSCGFTQSQAGLFTFLANSSISLITVCCCSWPYITAPSITDSGKQLASDSTITTAFSEPDTTKSRSETFDSEVNGFNTYWPSM